jgi:peptidyl-dipeptidase Dcp
MRLWAVLFFWIFFSFGSMASAKTQGYHHAFGCRYFVQVNANTPAWILENAFLKESEHFLQAIDFERMTEKTLKSALSRAYVAVRARIQLILRDADTPTFANTIEAIEFAFEPIEVASAVLSHLAEVRSTPTIETLQSEWSERLSLLSDELYLNPKLLARVETVERNSSHLSSTQNRLVQLVADQMRGNGAGLPEEVRAQIATLSARLSVLGTTFENNLKAEKATANIYISDLERLRGVPQEYVDAARSEAQAAGFDSGYLVHFRGQLYAKILSFAEDATLRKEIYDLRSSLAETGPNDNRPLVLEIAHTRQLIARLRGYQSHAHYVLRNRMVKDPKKAREFLIGLGQKYKAQALVEQKELRNFAGTAIQPQDLAYYLRKLKEVRYNFDAEQLRPYFELGRVLRGAFGVAEKLFGVRFITRNDIPVWHPSVSVYEVIDTQTEGRVLGLFYFDPHPRSDKGGGAFENKIRNGGTFFTSTREPHVVNVLNLSMPDSKTGQALLSFDEVTTVFHELGHALHDLLGVGRYSSLMGTSVAWDFVELPSQIFERWAIQPEVLATYALHHQTGEPLPPSLYEGLIESQNFRSGGNGLGQVRLAFLDLLWHDGSVPLPETTEQIADWEETVLKDLFLTQKKRPGIQSATFSHIFSGGYSSGYYSYKWSDVLASSAFQPFLRDGVFHPEWASRFRSFILEKGGHEDPDVLFERFLGHGPDPDDLLREEGLIP